MTSFAAKFDAEYEEETMNRVEKRMLKEMIEANDGYDLTEFREEIPELMGKVFPEDDAVNPKHYKDIVPGYEYFDVMDYMLADWHGSQAHALGNALKYLMRLNKKDSIPQELGKAIWYLERLKKDVEEKGKL